MGRKDARSRYVQQLRGMSEVTAAGAGATGHSPVLGDYSAIGVIRGMTPMTVTRRGRCLTVREEATRSLSHAVRTSSDSGART